MENAESIFNRFSSSQSGQRSIQLAIRDRVKETVFLEFKTARTPLSSDDKKNLSKVVSGFANSGGGVVIWGIATDRQHFATGLNYLDDTAAFQDEVNAVLPMVVIPSVSVQMTAINFDGTKGVVVMYIPQSDRAPHRAQLSDERGYFKRSQDSFRLMEHFDLEDMFGRRRRPHITPQFGIKREDYSRMLTQGKDPHLYWTPHRIDVTLHNYGLSVGKNVAFLIVFPPKTALRVSGDIDTEARHGEHPETREVSLKIIYPGVVYPEVPNAVLSFWVAPSKSVHPDIQVLQWRVLAEEMRMQTGTMGLPLV